MTDLTHLLLALRAQIVDSEGPIKIGPYTVDRRAEGAWGVLIGATPLDRFTARSRLGVASALIIELMTIDDLAPPCERCDEQPQIATACTCLPCELRS